MFGMHWCVWPRFTIGLYVPRANWKLTVGAETLWVRRHVSSSCKAALCECIRNPHKHICVHWCMPVPHLYKQGDILFTYYTTYQSAFSTAILSSPLWIWLPFQDIYIIHMNFHHSTSKNKNSYNCLLNWIWLVRPMHECLNSAFVP